uniref:Tc1-like transposase DDE domain-containing protein n=1 Tax=Amphimedon queenslandica TaxID=400682 RepID=A0A1X7TCR2_AMPQE
MNAAGFIEVLTGGLILYLTNIDNNPRFMQDNDPKHASKIAKNWLERNNVTWWKTPAKCPDLNPIENLWHELKDYFCRVVKPKTKSELVYGILKFWGTVDVPKSKYIRHLKKVVPKEIEANGGPTGY